MGKAGDDYATRAAAFRRLADELRCEKERSALLAIADQYEAVAARLRGDEGDEP
jgi:hypothetical protein